MSRQAENFGDGRGSAFSLLKMDGRWSPRRTLLCRTIHPDLDQSHERGFLKRWDI
jgi:hypothetical protein